MSAAYHFKIMWSEVAQSMWKCVFASCVSLRRSCGNVTATRKDFAVVPCYRKDMQSIRSSFDCRKVKKGFLHNYMSCWQKSLLPHSKLFVRRNGLFCFQLYRCKRTSDIWHSDPSKRPKLPKRQRTVAINMNLQLSAIM